MTDIPRTYSAKGEQSRDRLDNLAASVLEGAAMKAIITERLEQIIVHGFTPEHDLGHHPGELALAAASYINFAVDQLHGHGDDGKRPDPATWPWQREAWRPGDARTNLVKAVAIAWAAIDRLDGEPAQDGEARAA